MNDIYTMGVDIGSASSKCVILRNGTDISGESIVKLGAGTKGSGMAVEEALINAGVHDNNISCTVATGYGRNSFDEADKTMSELSCHSRGGIFIFKDVRTIIDIGGQDIKVLSLNENGQLQNFVMNDKCAAGTGRFLEVMAGVIDVKLEEMGDLDDKAFEKTPISSTCTVFAESEVISCMSKKVPIPNIVKGIHYSVASKVAGLAKRLGVKEPVALTGGVSKNKGVVKALAEELNIEIMVSEKSQLAGAIGAAIYAFEEYKKIKEGESYRSYGCKQGGEKS